MVRRRSPAGVLLIGLLLAACSSPTGTHKPLFSDKAIYLTSKIKMPVGDLAMGAIGAIAIYLIYDPLAPNWEVEEARLGEDLYHLDLRMKRYHTGGAGESVQIVKRRARQLQRELGYGGYEIVEYTEGIDSKTLGAQRVAEGTIRLINKGAGSPQARVAQAAEAPPDADVVIIY